MPQELKNHAWKWLSLFPGADIMTTKKKPSAPTESGRMAGQ